MATADSDKPRQQGAKKTVAGSKRSKEAASRAREEARGGGGLGEEDDDGDAYLPPKMTQRILEQAREQRDEMEEEDEGGAGTGTGGAVGAGGLAQDQVCFMVVFSSFFGRWAKVMRGRFFRDRGDKDGAAGVGVGGGRVIT